MIKRWIILINFLKNKGQTYYIIRHAINLIFLCKPFNTIFSSLVLKRIWFLLCRVLDLRGRTKFGDGLVMLDNGRRETNAILKYIRKT